MTSVRVEFTPVRQGMTALLTRAQLGFGPCRLWSPSPSVHHHTEPYALPKSLRIGLFGTVETGAKYSPPPYAVVVEGEASQAVLIVVVARRGWHLWNNVDFKATTRGVCVNVDLEGHSQPPEVRHHADVCLVRGSAGESRMALLARGMRELYPRAASRTSRGPSWWRRPIYCGWGDQVALSMFLEGVGPEPRALAYCTQGLYERWIRRLEQAMVPFGTVTIDAGWSPAGRWEPDKSKWPDLPGFIARQHRAGRRVLLWLGTWLWEGLADDFRVRAGKQRLVADPSNPRYLALVRRMVNDLISPRGCDADGFKIDQLAYAPTERRPFGGPQFGQIKPLKLRGRRLAIHGQGWGCELLHRLQKTIYDASHHAKADALISSSTVHPYFHDTLDMVRIHDMGYVAPDIFDAMKARVDLAYAALPGKVIDTDDWVHTDYAMWMRYTMGSHALGVPCIFYAERFMKDWRKEPATKEIPLADLRKIAAAWRHALR